MTRSTMKGLWLCAVLALAALFCVVTVINSIDAAAAEMTPAPAESAEPASAIVGDGTGFVLRDWNGRVAIFADGGGEPLTVTDIELDTLRRTDRNRLEQGMAIGGYEELLMLLEDLGS